MFWGYIIKVEIVESSWFFIQQFYWACMVCFKVRFQPWDAHTGQVCWWLPCKCLDVRVRIRVTSTQWSVHLKQNILSVFNLKGRIDRLAQSWDSGFTVLLFLCPNFLASSDLSSLETMLQTLTRKNWVGHFSPVSSLNWRFTRKCFAGVLLV